MILQKLQRYIYPAFIFVGGTIGVGFLSLPYVASKTGIWIFAIYMVLMTGCMVLLNRIFAEISLKTPDFKRFPGFTEYYFGKGAKFFVTFCLLIVSFGTLLVYLIVGGQFIASVFQPYFSFSRETYTLFYFVAAACIVFFNLKTVSRAIAIILSFLGLSLLLVFVEGFFNIKISNILLRPSSFTEYWFLPYGTILFSMWGIGFIPEVEEMIRKRKDGLKKIITISTICIATFYFLFTVLVLGISGEKTTPIALVGLNAFLNGFALPLALLAGAAAVFSAFVAHSNILKETLIYDLGIGKRQAFIMAMATPMILFFLGLNAFIPIISFLGGIILSLFGIIIVLMYKKIRGKPIIVYPLSLVFLIGIIYEIIYLLK